MKKKLTNNLFLRIVSIVAAFLFWLVIINITDPTTSRIFPDIPVQVLNENVITSANQVYEIEAGDYVSVTVKGKRSFVEKLTEKDFTATADLSELSKVNAVNVDVKLNKEATSGVEITWDNAVLKVNLEKRVTRKFKVEVAHQGELSEDYVLGEMVAKPNIVEVSCGESKFKKIDHVGVMVTLNGESEDFESRCSPVLYDANGDALDDTNVTYSKDLIRVTTEILETKEVPIHVTTTGTPEEGYRLVQTDYKPERVRVYGKKSALEKLTTIKIEIRIDGEKKDIEREIALADYLSEGLNLVGDIETVSVRCQIEKEGQRVMALTPSDIAVRNLPPNFTMNFDSEVQKYEVHVLGDETQLVNVQIADLGAYVDLTGLSDGSHTLDLQYTLPVGIRVKNKIKVKVYLRRQGENAVTSEPMETAEPSDEAVE